MVPASRGTAAARGSYAPAPQSQLEAYVDKQRQNKVLALKGHLRAVQHHQQQDDVQSGVAGAV